MNLPDYLAPAPPFNENAHGYDFPVRAKTFSEGLDWRAPCRCGAVGRIPQKECLLAVDMFWPFRRWMEKHIGEEERTHALKHKWGGASAFAPESSDRGIAVQDERVVEAVVVQNMPEGIDKIATTG